MISWKTFLGGGGGGSCYDSSYLGEFLCFPQQGFIQNLGFVKGGLSRKPGNRETLVNA